MDDLYIYPTYEEVVLGERLTLSPNIIKGSYPSVDKYLKTHFWLLREDFVSPLRKGIDDYRDHLERRDTTEFESYDVKIHKRVTFRKNPKNEPLTAVLCFDPDKRLRRKKLDLNNIFMFESLLCFTSDSFNTLLFATVSCRDKEFLNKYEIVVKFCEDYDEELDDLYCENFLMVESEAFFAPYKHVLTALKYMTNNDFPFKKYFIQASQEDYYPGYINQFTSIEVQGVHQKYRFDVKNFKYWPSASELGVNASQLVALKTALTRELAVIQGPPGTGKTFMALKITEILVKNKFAMRRKTPILVVCMTNHALDQFLVGMLKFTKKLVRIGGQSKRDELDDFNFNKMRGSRYQRLQRLAQQDVIGLTTTGAAKMRSDLDNLGCQVVIIEEAAEVLEAHVVACLSSKLEHLILIGDHKQLRPKVSVYELEKLNLHVSLFERMVINRDKCCTLQVQHRMAPEISQLIVPLIYRNLQNHQSVYNKPLLQSLIKRVSFVSHNSMEGEMKKNPSKRNKCEAKFLIALSKHLLSQRGYTPDEFTILTTYKGQLALIKELIKNDTSEFAENLANVRVAVVDDFQGEESNIILLSLVRSNANGNIGFLKTENRVCVALSRAKNGLVMVGNMDCLSSKSPLWHSIKRTLQSQDALSNSLTLRCEAHPHQTFHVETPEDFGRLAPNGGCNQPCGKVLDCGHRCKAMCHLDTACPKIVCHQPCLRLCNARLHRCPLKCYVKCGSSCMVKVSKYLKCRVHTIEVECKTDVRTVKCTNPCIKLNKGCRFDHKCPKLCHEECNFCLERSTVKLACGHLATIICGKPNPLCQETCTKKKLGCQSNHLCMKACYEICAMCEEQVIVARTCGHNLVKKCYERVPDGSYCNEMCSKKLDCGHVCQKYCYRSCRPCRPCMLSSIVTVFAFWRWRYY
ncbi:NFX1-type zinc finger-containing protein 1-like isoform X2 [Cloeon dipterum]|uniref:NFX1-type zinc finger-containing protein 1-like isoform X2 n=1 Tax=Cloeon dipterum TaxID=197152 RepID=UPI0032202024